MNIIAYSAESTKFFIQVVKSLFIVKNFEANRTF